MSLLGGQYVPTDVPRPTRVWEPEWFEFVESEMTDGGGGGSLVSGRAGETAIDVGSSTVFGGCWSALEGRRSSSSVSSSDSGSVPESFASCIHGFLVSLRVIRRVIMSLSERLCRFFTRRGGTAVASESATDSGAGSGAGVTSRLAENPGRGTTSTSAPDEPSDERLPRICRCVHHALIDPSVDARLPCCGGLEGSPTRRNPCNSGGEAENAPVSAGSPVGKERASAVCETDNLSMRST